MITFKSPTDLNKLQRTLPAYPVIKELVTNLIEAYNQPYLPDDYGYVVLIEQGDTERILTEIWDNWTLLDIPWEGIMKQGEFFICIFLANDEFGIVFVIPDAYWLTGDVRKMIDENLDV